MGGTGKAFAALTYDASKSMRVTPRRVDEPTSMIQTIASAGFDPINILEQSEEEFRSDEIRTEGPWKMTNALNSSNRQSIEEGFLTGKNQNRFKNFNPEH